MGYTQGRRAGVESLESRVLLSYPELGNDNFADAALLQGTQAKSSASFANATVEEGEPQPFPIRGATSSTLWWKWTAPDNGLFAIDVSGHLWPTVSVYVGDSLSHLSRIYATDRNTWVATKDVTYKIQVRIDTWPMGLESEAPGIAFMLTQTAAKAPSAESFVRTTPFGQPFVFSAGLFTEAFVPVYGMPLKSIVLGKIDAGDSIRLANPPVVRPTLQYQGGPASAGMEIPVSQLSELVYYPGSGDPNPLSFDWRGSNGLRWSQDAASATTYAASVVPPNDDWADRVQISGERATVTGTVTGATTEVGERNVSTKGSVWYEWTAPFDGLLHLSGVETRMYDGSPLVAGAKNQGAYVFAGHTYSIPVLGNSGSFTLNLLARQFLTITGTAGDDRIELTASDGKLHVNNNGELSDYDLADLAGIRVNAGDGSDLVSIGDGVSVAAKSSTVQGVDVYAGAGNDTVLAGAAPETIRGGQGDDLIEAGDGADIVYGGVGRDLVYGGAGADALYGKRGSDTIFGGAGRDSIYGNEGNDLLRGGLGHDGVVGDIGNDTIYGGRGPDTLRGGDGDDRIHGKDGNDELYGGSGHDLLNPGAGDDLVFATPESEIVDSEGNDVIHRTDTGDDDQILEVLPSYGQFS